MKIFERLRRIFGAEPDSSPRQVAKPFLIESKASSAAVPKLMLPRSADAVPEYRAAFEVAVEFTRSCGCAVDDGSWLVETLVTQDSSIIEDTISEARVDSVDGAAGQCLKWSHFLAPYVSRRAGCAAWVTIGQLWKSDGVIFDPTWDELRSWKDDGVQRGDFRKRSGLNLHAWITLQTGEIIDFTFYPSLAAVYPEYAPYAGLAVFGRDPNVVDSFRYFPMAVGSEFAETVSARSMFPLLARDPADLQQRFAVLTSG